MPIGNGDIGLVPLPSCAYIIRLISLKTEAKNLFSIYLNFVKLFFHNQNVIECVVHGGDGPQHVHREDGLLVRERPAPQTRKTQPTSRSRPLPTKGKGKGK